MADDRWLVVGLGNPGDRYAQTRHNVGADIVRHLATREHVSLSVNKRTRCAVAETVIAGSRFVLAIPETYMNRSGGPVQSVSAWYKVPAARIIVCHDDLDLEVGALRLKRGGGHGGHNGLRDIDQALGSRDYLRVRVGIGRPPGQMVARDYVLRRFPPADRATITAVSDAAGDAIVALATDGLEPTQNRFHSRPN